MLSTVIDLDELAGAVNAAGLDNSDVVAIAADLSETLTRLKTERTRLTNDAAASTDRLARLIAGNITLEEALVADVLGLDTPAGKSKVSALAERGMDHARRRAAQQLRPVAPAMFDKLAEIDRALVAEATELAATIDGIDTDAAAMAATPEARDAWARVIEIIRARRDLEEVAKILRNAQVLADIDHRRVHPSFLRFRHPDRQPDGLARLHPVCQILGRIAVGAEPGLYSAEEATAWQAAADLEDQ